MQKIDYWSLNIELTGDLLTDLLCAWQIWCTFINQSSFIFFKGQNFCGHRFLLGNITLAPEFPGKKSSIKRLSLFSKKKKRLSLVPVHVTYSVLTIYFSLLKTRWRQDAWVPPSNLVGPTSHALPTLFSDFYPSQNLVTTWSWSLPYQ